MNESIPIASYTELLQRRLSAIRTLNRSLRESQNALLSRDVLQTSQFTEQQAELCNEIEYLDRDIRSADEIIAWAKALQPNTREITELKRHSKSAGQELVQSCQIHSSLVRRAKRSLTVMMNVKAMENDGYYSPSSYRALQASEEV